MKRIACAVLLIITLILPSCSSKPLSATDFLLDTIVTVTLYSDGSEDILNQSMALCKHYDELFSKSNPNSDISRINASNGNPVEVSEDTIELLKTALEYGQLSDGAFDVTIGAASSLWDFKSENPKLPDNSKLSKAAAAIDYKKVLIDGNTVQLTEPGAQLDMGAIAKGYIADRMSDFLRECGVTSAIINLGGNVCVIGDKFGHPFQVGIRNPTSLDGSDICRLSLTNTSAVTSGSYERGFSLNGKRYHHILDPSTAYPADSDLLSVTIICESSVDADAFSTICFIKGSEGSASLLREYPDISAVLVDLDGNISYINAPPISD